MALEVLGGDYRITVHCQEPRVVRKSHDGGVVRLGQIGGENYVEQGAKNTALGDTGLHFVAVGVRAIIPDL